VNGRQVTAGDRRQARQAQNGARTAGGRQVAGRPVSAEWQAVWRRDRCSRCSSLRSRGSSAGSALWCGRGGGGGRYLIHPGSER